MNMMIRTLAVFSILAIFVGATIAEEILSESEYEVVYRVPRGVRGGKNRGGACHYKKGPWEECDKATNTEIRILALNGGDSSCEQTKILKRKCKKACKYEKGDWSECSTVTNTRTRTDNLKPKSNPACQTTRTVTKKCKKVCRYNKQASWTECDPSAGKKSKIMSLASGDSTLCEPTKTITKPCRAGRRGGRQSDDHKGLMGTEE